MLWVRACQETRILRNGERNRLLTERYFRDHETVLARTCRRSISLLSYLVRRLGFSHRPLGPPDWIQTPHSTEWAFQEPFRSSYDSAIRRVGEDYRIPWRVQTLVWGASIAVRLPGDFVELGTGRGFSMIAVADSIKTVQGEGKTIWCYDTFVKPSESGLGRGEFENVYASSVEAVEKSFHALRGIHFVVGDVRETLLENVPEEISFLHVDLNDPSTESWAIKLLWRRVVVGGLIILDDFANRGMDETNRVIRQTFHELDSEVLSLPSGQGLVIKSR